MLFALTFDYNKCADSNGDKACDKQVRDQKARFHFVIASLGCDPNVSVRMQGRIVRVTS